MKILKPVSFGNRGGLGKKVEAKTANGISAKCAISASAAHKERRRRRGGDVGRTMCVHFVGKKKHV
jgi:hypothetical protein